MGEALVGPQPGQRRARRQQQAGGTGRQKGATIDSRTHGNSPG